MIFKSNFYLFVGQIFIPSLFLFEDVLYDTHPAPEKRIAKLQKEIAGLL